MRALIHALLLVAVALCGMHVAEPVQAHAETAHHFGLEAAVSLDTGHHHKGGEQRSADAAHANAHHCPLAADQRGFDASNVAFTRDKPVAPPVRALASRATAPLEEPPLD